MIIDGIGLSGHDDHTEKETADLRMLPRRRSARRSLMYRLSLTSARRAALER